MRLSALLGTLSLLAACGKSAPPATPPTAPPPAADAAEPTPAPPDAAEPTAPAAPDTVEPAAAPDTAGAPTQAAGACVPAVVETEDKGVQVQVDGVSVAIPTPEMAEVALFHQVREGKLLLGVSVSTHVHLGYAPGGVLWQLDCAHLDAAPVKYYAEEGADFGVAIPSPDGGQLYYSRADGLGRLDLASKRAELLVPAPPVDRECAEYRGEEGVVWLQRIFPERLGEPGLVVLMGATCGYEGDWELRRYVVAGLDDPKARRLVRTTHVAALAVGPTGAVWLGDAGCESYLVEEAQTDGIVWRSKDGGVSWTPVHVAAPFEDEPEGEARPLDGAVADVIVDAKDGDHVVVRSPVCEGSAASTGGDVLVTRNDGKTWTRVAAPFESESDGGLGVAHLWSPDGDADHLFAADSGEGEGEDAPRVSESKDGGKTWQAVEGVKVPARAAVTAVKVGDATLTPGLLGLTRTPADGASEVTFPPPNWRAEVTPGVSLRRRVERTPVGWAEVTQAEELNTKGLKLARKKQLDEAIAAYGEALKADPNHDLTRFNLACAQARAGRLDEAMATLEELSTRGGYQALAALGRAGKDADLQALWGRPELRRITTVGVLPAAFLQHDYDADADRLAFVVASDPFERMCVWALPGTAKEAVIDRVDCATGLSVGEKRTPVADLGRLDGWLQGLGMVAWPPITDAKLVEGAAKWLEANRAELAAVTLEDLAGRVSLYQSPSGPDGRVAVVVDGTPPLRLLTLASALRPADGTP